MHATYENFNKAVAVSFTVKLEVCWGLYFWEDFKLVGYWEP